MGIKHNAVAQIFSFQQRDHETVRDCVNRLKQYIARCPEEEKPSQARLISIFLEGLKNRTLYAHLYACKHTTFNECCMDAMDFDDNFDDSSTSSQVMDRERRQTSSDASSSKVQNPDNIVDMVLRRLGQTYQPPYRQTNYAPAPTPTAWTFCLWNLCWTSSHGSMHLLCARRKPASYSMLVSSMQMEYHACYEGLRTY